jgi:hypothetical protein
MWKHEVSVFAASRPHVVWRLVSQPAWWSRWDPLVEYAELDGPFVRGSAGRVRLRGGPTLDGRLIHVDPDKKFVLRAGNALAAVYELTHEVRPTAHGVRIVLRLTISGPLGPMLGVLTGRRIRAALDNAALHIAKSATVAAGALETPEPHLLH